MTPKTTTKSLILATFALVGVMTSGAIVPAAFAQTVDPFTDEGGLLDQFLADDGGTDSTTDSTTDSGSITDGTESTDETQNQATSQDETNNQSNSLDQDQTGAINQEIASGENSEAASAADSSSDSTSESTYKTKSKSGSTPSYPGTSDSISDSTSDSISDVSNTGTLGQNQELSNPTQVNTNNAGDDESRSATVGFDLGFEQFTEQDSTVPGIGTSVPIVIPR
jgi:ABC-type Na+ efflux pump permease subunit